MKQEDLAIAKILRIKKDQERLRKENMTELLNFKSRVIDLIETFVTKQPVHAAIATIVTSLVEISQNLLVRKGIRYSCIEGEERGHPEPTHHQHLKEQNLQELLHSSYVPSHDRQLQWVHEEDCWNE